MTRGSELLERTSVATPAIDAFRRYREQILADAASDARLLALCWWRLASLLGVDPAELTQFVAPDDAASDAEVADLGRWTTSDRFSARDRAVLSFAEQWLLDPSLTTDEQCLALREALGDEAAAAFTLWLSVVEASLRVELALSAR
jgi:hypothetical protein